MKASIIYAYRFLTHNKKKSFSVWISLVLAAAMISICFFTVDSIDFTILNDAKSESCGYNLYLFGKTSTVQDLLLNHKNKIEKISQTEITGSISPFSGRSPSIITAFLWICSCMILLSVVR